MGSKQAGRGDSSLRLLFEASSDGMLLADEHGMVFDANPTACRLLDRGPEGLIGSPLEDLFDPVEAGLGPAWEKLRRSRRFDGRWLLRRADGTSFPVEVALRASSDEGISMVFGNPGERPGQRERLGEGREENPGGAVPEGGEAEERLRESEERHRALSENALDLVAVLRADNTIGYASPSFERLLGHKPEDLVGSLAADYIHPEDLKWAWPLFYESIQDPRVRRTVVIRYRHKNGVWRWFESAFSNQLDNPAVRGLVFNCRDVTERIQAEEELKASEERLRALVENAQDFILLADENNVTRYVSPAIERIMGFTPEEFVGTPIAAHVHPDYLERTLGKVAETLPIPGPHNMGTIKYRRKDGSDVYLEVVVNNRLDDPVLRGVVCNCRDVTERVEAEEALRESEERHRALNENALDFVVVQKADNTLAYVSPSIERLLGWNPEEAVGRMGADFIHPEDLEWAWPVFYEMLSRPGLNETVTIRYKHKDGRWRWFESACNNQLDNLAVGGLVFNCRDVTERVEAEERLREAEERYRLLVEQVPAATYIERGDTESSTVYVSPQIEEMLGYTPEEWTSDPGLWLSTIHPEDHGRVLARHLRCNETGEPFDEEYRCQAKDGREVWVRDEAVLVRDAAGESLYWQGVKADITARKRAELEILRLNTELRGQVAGYTAELKAAIEGLKESEGYLREREEQFHATFERAAVGIAHVSPEGRWLRVNGKLCEILGYGREELLQRTFQDITHPADLDADLEQVERLLSGEIGEYSMEKRYFKKDGSTVWANLSVSLVRRATGKAGHFFIAVVEDITSRKGAEALLKALSPREIEVLGHVARGRTNVEIASELAFSPNTVKAHVASVIEKLGVSDRTEAAVYAVEMGLFTPQFRVPEKLPPHTRSAQ